MKYRVTGTIECGIDMLVEAESKDEAIEKAHEEWPGMSNYVGNGKTGGAMCGPHQTDDEDANIEAEGSEPKFTDAFEEE